ncbi:phosphoribosyltransferase-like protein [Microdochium trichocladiopsis]|uniref:Orotate phosphoribosyltransferase n=1 Tax=Microdochium trichocladiopsis TaxID=1682393 RepID=A0A9P8Y516_9PEZI|nr:phosphoribosyltransferase-like protein [Microdochium trichocladiopsis]KAH7031327.1 phosphoribosyltransferase-like protein [Microdochium trichocladiopsis]
MSNLASYKTSLLEAALSGGALRFGSFTLKSGRQSPYFFNAGSFFTGALHVPFVDAFASTITSSPEIHGQFDVLFGPAYKGIPLAAAVFYALAKQHPELYAEVGYTFDRKEAKDHGEGGVMVGAPLQGKRVLVIDDVVSSGTAKREAIEKITSAGGKVVGIVVAVDRQETLPDGKSSAIGELKKEYGIPILAIVNLEDILTGMKGKIADTDIVRLEEYRATYGASD